MLHSISILLYIVVRNLNCYQSILNFYKKRNTVSKVIIACDDCRQASKYLAKRSVMLKLLYFGWR